MFSLVLFEGSSSICFLWRVLVLVNDVLCHVMGICLNCNLLSQTWSLLVQDVLDMEELKNMKGADGIDPERKEEYLSDEQFKEAFGTDKESFAAMPKWKRQQKKKAVGLF
jgi:hypothetical protein